MVVQAVLFFGIVLVVVTVVHYYLWRRLVRDTTRPGRARRIGTWVLRRARRAADRHPHRQPGVAAWRGGGARLARVPVARA